MEWKVSQGKRTGAKAQRQELNVGLFKEQQEGECCLERNLRVSVEGSGGRQS